MLKKSEFRQVQLILPNNRSHGGTFENHSSADQLVCDRIFLTNSAQGLFQQYRPNPAIARARLRKRLAEDFPIAVRRFNPARRASRTSLDARGLIGRRPTDA